MLLDLPLLSFDEVFHVGTLDAADRKERSYEGEGLSVSVHPEDWADIARLGDCPTWALRKATLGVPLRFVSWHDMTEADRDTLRAWGAARGWVEQRQVFRLSWYDDEWDDTFHMDFDTEAEARAEAQNLDEAEQESVLAPVTVWRPTTAFPDTRIDTDTEPTDVLLCAYLRETHPEIDGVWWDDTHDRHRLTCPRGVLVHDLSGYVRAETR